MYLKSITLKGFKSFVDRTCLEFGPGTSVIVGPNGSGKSNVTDAVLWALGEQSPLAVRGHSMQDVIFGGSPGRKAAPAAEVEIVLADDENRLGLGAEVAIERRLDRSGEGEYRIGGAKCRLVDVLEVLSDTGLGKEMHSVISQGRIEAIVTSRPRDRRLLIEEAAGLGKHRKRRRRAQLKLGHTQDNLDRALDVEREARTRLKPLKRQAEAAELHARLHRQTLEVRWELTRDDARTRRSERDASGRAAVAARSQRTSLEAELGAVSRRRAEAEEALAARTAERERLARRSYAAQSAADRIGDRTGAVRADVARVERRLARGREELVAAQAEAAQDSPDTGLEERIDVRERELAALERDRDAELARQLAELESERDAAAATHARYEAELDGARRVREAADAAFDAARQAVTDAEREVDRARRESARVGGELAAVNQFLRSHQTAPGGAASLADGLTVAAGAELAVAAALDGRLGAALVDDARAAATLLDRCGRDGGRVLIASGQSADPDGRAPAAAPSPDAVRLAEQVGGESTAAALARELLADAWLVDRLDAIPADFGGVAVTRAGRVFSPGLREYRQAPKVGDDRVLAERNRRDDLVAASERAARDEHAARARVAALTADAESSDRERQRAIAAHRQAVAARDDAAEAQRRIEAQIGRRRSAPDEGENASRRALLTAEIAAERAGADRAARERGQRQRRIAELRAQAGRDERLAPVLSTLADGLAAVAEAVAAARHVFDAALTADREAGEHVAATLRACAQEESALQRQLMDASNAVTSAEVGAQRARDRAEETDAVLVALAAELELPPEPATEPIADADRASLEDRLGRLGKRREQLGPVNPLAEEEYAEAVAHVEELEHQRTDLETALRELEKLIRDTDREIRETFEQTFAAAAAHFENLAGRVFPGGTGRLRLVSENDGQAARVIGAQKVADTTEDPSEEPDELPGAEAEDLLGVEIEITPAGKAMKRLTLLSGGEKSMTALAFLFAVFLARPCPFYIMDEVEAALDDLNITRFLDLLDTYSDRAQFIVVTHQKRTMEAADALYGVSMGGDGISKVISRRLPARVAA